MAATLDVEGDLVGGRELDYGADLLNCLGLSDSRLHVTRVSIRLNFANVGLTYRRLDAGVTPSFEAIIISLVTRKEELPLLKLLAKTAELVGGHVVDVLPAFINAIELQGQHGLLISSYTSV